MEYDTIFKNTLKLLAYRGYVDIPKYSDISEDIKQTLKRDRKYEISVKHTDGKLAVVALDTDGALGKTMIYSTAVIKRTLKTKADTYIIICQSKITKDVFKLIKDMSDENGIKIEFIPFSYMKYNFTKRIPVCKYRIIPKDKIDEVVDQQRLSSRVDMPIIYHIDNAVVWLGAVPGDVIVEITHTEKAIKEKKYLLVKFMPY